MIANPSIIKLNETKSAKKNWSSWIWLKIKSSPMNVGDIGNPESPKQATKKTKAKRG